MPAHVNGDFAKEYGKEIVIDPNSLYAPFYPQHQNCSNISRKEER